MTCSVYNLKYSGTVTKTYNTRIVLSISLSFNISPNSGKAQDTLFTLTVTKPSNYNIWCKFGYVST